MLVAAKAGDRVGPYELIERTGSGGMGEVWKALDARFDRLVAVKFSKEQFSQRFSREAKAIAALNHPNICAIYDVGRDYIVMEYVDGRR
jgi:eukaryotic-like serine/threonine-protein kinase